MCNAHQHGRECFGHGKRAHGHARFAVVLIALGHHFAFVNDQQTGGLRFIHKVVYRFRKQAPLPRNYWRCFVIRQRPRVGRRLNRVPRKSRRRYRPSTHPALGLEQSLRASLVTLPLPQSHSIGTIGTHLEYRRLGL